MIEFYRYDRWDGYLGPIAGVKEATHKQEAGGENSLTLVTEGDLSKGDRIVWLDDQGVCHEHVANEPSASRDGGAVTYTTYCEDALNELFRDPVGEVRIRSGSAREALAKILENTRWEVGTVNVSGARTKSFYHISAGEALQNLVETWGGEAYSSFAADDFGITHRYVNLVEAMGSRSTHKRFEYGKDLVSVKRTVSSDDVYTAMRGYGKGDDLGDDDDSTNGRRITFAEINGGKDYVEDLDALEKWGRPDGKGGKAHAFGTVTFSDCEDPAELKELTQQELDGKKEPKVSYECKVQDLAAMGYDYEGTAIGDDVQVVDTAFTPDLELEARVMSIERNLFDASDGKITIGNIRESIGGELSSINSSIESIKGQSSSWDAAVNFGATYLQRIIDALNERFDAMGSYLAFSFEQGLTVSSVPLDKEGRPTTTPASAIQLKGGGFRIASTLKADGSFDWRTFGTGEGFVADYIVAGSLMAGLINTGVLLVGDEDDPVFMADFDSGKVAIKGSSVTIGAGSAEDAIAGLEDGVDAARAVYGYCSAASATQTKAVQIDGFKLDTGSIVTIRFAHGNTASTPKLNISGTGAKPIMLDGALLAEKNYWRDDATVTFAYSEGYWHVADAGTHALIEVAENAINLEVSGVKDDLSKTKGSIEVLDNRVTTEVNDLQDGIDAASAVFGVCSTASATQVKAVQIDGFKLREGATVSVRFTYANTAEKPKLNVSGTGDKWITLKNTYLPESSWWATNDTVTFVYSGGWWRVADSGAYSRIDALADSITLSVTNGKLGSRASIKVGVDGSTKTGTVDLTDVREAFADDGSYVSIDAGRVTFNAGTVVINSTNFKVSSTGTVTANNISAKGTFECGSTYGIKLNSSGQMAGYRNGSKVGYIDYSASMRYIPTGEVLYGVQVQATGMIRLSSPHISVLASSNTSQTSTRASTGEIWVAGWDSSPGDGWSTSSMRAYQLSFINGLCTSGNVN